MANILPLFGGAQAPLSVRDSSTLYYIVSLYFDLESTLASCRFARVR